MTQTVKQVKSTKVVQVIARFQFKNDARKVVYRVWSSDGKKQYEVSLFDGKATGCTCISSRPCYHMLQLEMREQERYEQHDKTYVAAVDDLLESFYEADRSDEFNERGEYDPIVTPIRDGKFVEVRFSELNESERRQALNAMFA